ncbi:MAG: hypothetical protein KKE62_18345 [Proteobacteria bacterium]|nr:hypothetical protein [Pseudomonadota bacterium]MBU1389234.1 hypothetical protein [Pseudomonadota bacterium]MBU1544798.1 hypothetical protein [Pseudomonadota bacterium]MBU2430746.1 hypothetical protein [Pseudomonadota bacterium]
MITCEKCHTPVDINHINSNTFEPCTKCQVSLRTDIFPAAVRTEAADTRPQMRVVSDDAGCFYHPGKKAVVPCAACGRFLCALCDIDMNGRHICFACMESGQEKQTAQTLETHRFLHDGLAIRLSLFPPLSGFFSFFSCVTAPFSVYYALRHWKSPGSITPRGRKWRFVLTLLFSSAQIAGWTAIILTAFNR